MELMITNMITAFGSGDFDFLLFFFANYIYHLCKFSTLTSYRTMETLDSGKYAGCARRLCLGGATSILTRI
jgi:hypothetical protein